MEPVKYNPDVGETIAAPRAAADWTLLGVCMALALVVIVMLICEPHRPHRR